MLFRSHDLPFDIILERLQTFERNLELEWIPERRRVVEDDLNGGAVKRGMLMTVRGKIDLVDSSKEITCKRQDVSSTRSANVDSAFTRVERQEAKNMAGKDKGVH